jgi:hypothetical protein
MTPAQELGEIADLARLLYTGYPEAVERLRQERENLEFLRAGGMDDSPALHAYREWSAICQRYSQNLTRLALLTPAHFPELWAEFRLVEVGAWWHDRRDFDWPAAKAELRRIEGAALAARRELELAAGVLTSPDGGMEQDQADANKVARRREDDREAHFPPPDSTPSCKRPGDELVDAAKAGVRTVLARIVGTGEENAWRNGKGHTHIMACNLVTRMSELGHAANASEWAIHEMVGAGLLTTARYKSHTGEYCFEYMKGDSVVTTEPFWEGGKPEPGEKAGETPAEPASQAELTLAHLKKIVISAYQMSENLRPFGQSGLPSPDLYTFGLLRSVGELERLLNPCCRPWDGDRRFACMAQAGVYSNVFPALVTLRDVQDELLTTLDWTHVCEGKAVDLKVLGNDRSLEETIGEGTPLDDRGIQYVRRSDWLERLAKVAPLADRFQDAAAGLTRAIALAMGNVTLSLNLQAVSNTTAPPVGPVQAETPAEPAATGGDNLAVVSQSAPEKDTALFLSPAEIAEKYNVPLVALQGRLKRWRASHADGWREVVNRKPKEPQYLYQVSAVWNIIADLRATS